jgi:hypothetical protein
MAWKRSSKQTRTEQFTLGRCAHSQSVEVTEEGLIVRNPGGAIFSLRDVRAVDRWMNGSELYGDAEQRLRFAFQLVRMLAEREDSSVIQSWLTGLNPELGDRVPLRLMRENDLETVAPEIMGAARAFLVGG